MGPVASLLAMDRTTLTAALKPLQRRGLVDILADPADRRSRRLLLTDDGRALMARALPIWTATHAALDRLVTDMDRLRAALRAVTVCGFDFRSEERRYGKECVSTCSFRWSP